MHEIYVKESLAALYSLIMDKGEEIYTSQDGLIMDMIYENQTYRIHAIQTTEGYILVDCIERR